MLDDAGQMWHPSRVSVSTSPGEVLRRLREAKGLTQEELARRAGAVSVFTISRLERGLHHPRLELAYAIARVLEVEVDEIWPRESA